MSQALQFLILTTAGWLNRQHEDAIDYLSEENRVLREQLGSKRIRFTDAQRKRLARRGKKLGRKVLRRLAGIATPDMILRS
jgi:putative transposase